MSAGHRTGMEPTTPAGLADLLDRMRDDLALGGEPWENATLPGFLEALSAVLRDGDGSLFDGGGSGLTFGEIASVLKAAAIYE